MKKFDNYKSNLAVLSKAPDEDLENEFIDEKVWLSMLKEKNDMTHIYDGNEAKELVRKIIHEYIPTFYLMKEEIENRYQEIIETL